MRDLDIRGAGNLLGAEQSGFVNDLGFEMYHKVLDEAVQELRESEFKDLFETKPGDLKMTLPDTVIETDLQVVIPERYVSNISERLALYTRLDSLSSEDELTAFHQEVLDRFGPIPDEVENLIKMVNVRWKAEQLYLEKLTLKNNILKGYFVSNGNDSRAVDSFFTSDQFGRVIEYIKRNPSTCSLRESKERLVFTHTNVFSVEQVEELMAELTK
jgi:transcription-repair coupling factor (superfamily II helicase)